MRIKKMIWSEIIIHLIVQNARKKIMHFNPTLMLPSFKKNDISFNSKSIAFTILNEIITSITNDEKIEKKKKTMEFLLKQLVDINKKPIIRQLKFVQK